VWDCSSNYESPPRAVVFASSLIECSQITLEHVSVQSLQGHDSSTQAHYTTALVV
jgi:hypothetical protein